MFVIVYGALRSGTTLLRLMLDMHPGLSCPGETDFLLDFTAIAPDGTVTIDADRLGRNRIYRASRARLDPALPGREALIDMIGQLRDRPDQCVVLMLHRGIETALRLFPDTPVLHMLRDPRDVARSSIGMGWAGTVYHGVEHWLRTEREWDRAMAAFPGTRTMTLHSERLILAPAEELARITSFVGLPFDPAMLDYHRASTYDPPDASLVEQWRRNQTARDLGLVEARLGPLLTARGYAPSGHRPVFPRRMERVALQAMNKRAIWSLRVKRHGLRDPLLVGLAKRLRLPALGHAAQARIDARTVSEFLK